MLQGGYFIGNIGNNNGGNNEEVYLENGEIVFSPVDPIHIDENGDVFFDSENKNARMHMDATQIYVEKVI